MHYTTLGRTGFRVSRMGLGCGGHSRLGLRYGVPEVEAERVVREAIDVGVNFIDTAEGYGTEEVVGRAIANVPRESLVLSTKVGVTDGQRPIIPEELRTRLDGCLSRLRTDYVDVLHLHGVRAEEYDHARDVLAPAMYEWKAAGKIRAVGITEAFAPDPGHRMLGRAVQDDAWDVVMVGFNLLNQSARERILRLTQTKRIGTLCMFAVRRALSQPDVLRSLLNELAAQRIVDGEEVADELAFLTAPEVADSLPEAAYRFCLDEPGLDVILSGTGSIDHLKQNARWMSGSPLPSEIRERLTRIFARVDSVSGN
ncbi:MAG: aldo/keto reductase [Fimbriimonas sp.]